METKKTILNKDGSPRKTGSGRKKGSNSFVKITFGQLKEYIGEKTPMVVSRVWLESLGLLDEKEEVAVSLSLTEDAPSSKIAFSIKNFDEE